MHPATHLSIDPRLCGTPLDLEPGRATVRFTASPDMAVDERGLVHGGFVFGLADHAAMLAVNAPTVVLGGADVRFTSPVKVGDVVTATATRTEEKGNKHVIEVRVEVDDVAVLTGSMTAFVLDAHVLEGR